MVRIGGRPTDYTEPLPTADRMDGLQVTILHEAPVSAPPRLIGIFRIRNLPAWGQKDLAGEEVGPLLGGEVLVRPRWNPSYRTHVLPLPPERRPWPFPR